MNGSRPFPLVAVTVYVALMAGVAGVFIYLGPTIVVTMAPGRTARSFYISAQSMLPTLEVNDQVLPMTLNAAPLRRGSIVVITANGETRIDRVVAFGGETVALRNGHVTVDGRSAAYRTGGAGPVFDDGPTRIVFERLPDEDLVHRVLDTGPSSQDDFGPVTVPAGELFLLGDNRDRAADSRFSYRDGGVSMVPQSAVFGAVDTLSWSRQRWRIGRPIDDWAPPR